MSAREIVIDQTQWRKSRRSVGNGACVEIAPATGSVAVRDSTDRIGLVLEYPARAWGAFIADTKIGSFDVTR
ncbi:MAG: DUF397 domain-containing protein [Trebonia sp.]|jgi:hypothetical protein